MVAFSSILPACLLLSAAHAAPVYKRIAQNTIDAPAPFEKACDAAGGGQECNQIKVAAAQTLLAAGGNCDQQNAGDQMVDAAKKLNNDAAMINAAQIFVQQPRNSPNSQSVPYCQTPPKNPELNGLFQCQFQSVNPKVFSGDQTGNKPLGVANLNPPGSCPANPQGPIPDGQQLSDLVSSPGTPQGGSGGAAAGGSNSTADAGASDAGSADAGSSNSTASAGDSGAAGAGVNNAAADPAASDAGDASDAGSDASGSASDSGADATASAAAPAASGSAAAGSNGGGFQAQNGQDAQALNDKFKSLTADSPCNNGDEACINGGFAQCAGGKFQITQCAGGTTCQALPLVNKPGTSITCSTAADAAARIKTAEGS